MGTLSPRGPCSCRPASPDCETGGLHQCACPRRRCRSTCRCFVSAKRRKIGKGRSGPTRTRRGERGLRFHELLLKPVASTRNTTSSSKVSFFAHTQTNSMASEMLARALIFLAMVMVIASASAAATPGLLANGTKLRVAQFVTESWPMARNNSGTPEGELLISRDGHSGAALRGWVGGAGVGDLALAPL